MLKLTQQELTLDAAGPNGMPRRTLAGLALPYNVEATVNDGTKVMFMPGSLNSGGKMPKLYLGHDSSSAVGLVTSMVDTPGGMMYEARISETTLGNEALVLAQDGVLDAVSVGVNPTRFSYNEAGTMIIESADWQELSLVPYGAFAGASVDRVSASQGIPQEPVEIDIIETETPNEELDTMTQPTETPQVIEAASVAPVVYAQARQFKLPTAAEFIAASVQGGNVLAEMNARIQASAPNITTADTLGILPEIITGSVYDGLNPIRPFVTAIGAKAMPGAGATFRRPKITVRPVVTEQPTGQLNPLDPSTVTVANNNVDKLTFGTYVTMSEQDLDWTDPASINIVLNQLAIAYGQATDSYAVNECYDQISQSETVTDKTKPADWLAAIYGAAYQISNTSNYLPTHLVCDPTTWYRLGKLTATDGTPAFPFVGAPNMQAFNALGTSAATSWNGTPLGLTLVVDKNLGADQAFVGHAAGDAAGFEFYEMQKGAISVDVPSTLGRTIAYRGYAAQFMADATKFCKLV
ncbi:Prohead protease [uncultured Caudovirales phage]|uniref:Prohead protease n=1 Tax=uncultured Caudovirales phage TaxID=2100421 RepID=A0A6J5RAV2_9CAUD|nr:Prohead protease [uncultured Caudovirales phage]